MYVKILFSLIFLTFIITCVHIVVNLQKGNWQTLKTKNFPVARHENSCVEVKGKVYLLGGRNIENVSIYDPVIKTWTKGSKPPLELHHFQAVVWRDRIYIVCAQTGRFPHEKPLANVYIYDPAADKWTKGHKIPEERRRGSAGTVLYQNKIYISCGIIDGHWDGHVNWLDEYDPESGNWQKLPDAPRSRDHFAAVVHAGKLYNIGGRRSSKKNKQVFHLTIPEIDIYDFTENSWKTPAAEIPVQRAGTSAVVFHDRILVMGGESTQKKAHDNVDVYNPEQDTWKKLKPLVHGRHGTAAFVYQNKVFIASGSGNRGGGPELNSIEAFTLRIK